jgi:uncharacterized protein (DUF58 family)
MFHGRHHISMLPGVHVGVMSALLHVILLLLIIIMMLLVMLLVVVVVVLALPLAGHHRHVSSAGRCCPILLRVFNSAQHGPRARRQRPPVPAAILARSRTVLCRIPTRADIFKMRVLQVRPADGRSGVVGLPKID